VDGLAEGPFAPVRDIFGREVGAQGRGGAALCVYLHGRRVVDLVGGTYQTDSIQLLFSVTKLITAIACSMAHEHGQLDLDAPIGSYWPGFNRPTTRSITLRHVLGHRSGLAAIEAPLTLTDMLAGYDEELIERQEPFWEPNTAHGYHGFTFGTLTNGAFRHVLGHSVGDFVRDQIATPLALDLWVGLPETELGRLETILYEPPAITAGRAAHLRATAIPLAETSRAQQEGRDLYNDPRVAQACWPAASGVASARALAAAVAAALDDVDGSRLLTTTSSRAMAKTQSLGIDRVLGVITHFGSGVQRPFPQLPLLTTASFGHEAGGGSLVAADPSSGLVIAFTTNVFPAVAGASAHALALLPAIHYCAHTASRD
jgi:CubicO group peptidase (beta-lactamase class C family)